MKKKFRILIANILASLMSNVYATNNNVDDIKLLELTDILHSSSNDRAVVEVIDNLVVRDQFSDTLFGFNINYQLFQEQLWDKKAQKPKSGIVDHLKYFPGALYRYPGGLVANSFNWSDAIGNVDSRRLQKSIANDRSEKAYFGIDEFMGFVNEVNGKNIYVLNLVGLNPEKPLLESNQLEVGEHNSALVRYLMTHEKRQSITYFQLGNELDRHKYEWSPDKYVERALASANEILKVNENAQFIAFLRDFELRYKHQSSKGVSRPFDFMKIVLDRMPMINDFSLHHYYDGKREDGKNRDITFWLKNLRKSISDYKEIRNGKTPNIWITEHARQMVSDKPANDLTRVFTSNLGGALSTADYIIAIAQIPEVKGACWHGLNAGPWQLFDYSVKHRDLRPRPIYWGLRVLRMMNLPTVLGTKTSSPNNSKYTGGYDIRATAFHDKSSDELGIWVVNRSAKPIETDIVYRPFTNQKVTVKHYFVSGSKDANPDDPDLEPVVELDAKPNSATFSKDGELILRLPPTSISTFMITRQHADSHSVMSP